MSSLRTFSGAALVALPILAILPLQPVRAETAAPAGSKPAPETTAAAPAKKTFTKAEIEAFLTKCSVEADEKGLTKAKNKLAERKAFRRTCMSKFGVEPKSAKVD